ncbi:MAG: AAA family ATPase [Planctomycetes bacterium]|nr:AAA family ATPase [Planctomycetota bacterium]
MEIKRLILDNFGPFRRYDITFTEDEPACVLLTGKNNEGKSNIILALKLLSSACRSVGRRNMYTIIDDNEYFKLPQQDVQGIKIGRMLHNYSGEHAKIKGIFENNLTITVHLNENKDLIYADYNGRIPSNLTDLLGFIPPLGPLAETEDLLGLTHIKSSINTSLSPRHLRNHLVQILDSEEYNMVQEIIKATWPSIRLMDYSHNLDENSLTCFFMEGRMERELAWAGQGLQVWFQLITHLIRLRNSSVLVLDEPEVNLHAEKQNDLVQVLKEHHKGSVIIATHSAELMNNVDVSHIIHVQKRNSKPTLKKTTDRTNLNLVRSQVGSNFNLIASQFEAVDLILFTEDVSDFKIIQKLAIAFGFRSKVFNIPLHGFSQYPKAINYRDAYKLLIGNDTPHRVVLDRDYYPDVYLAKAKRNLAKNEIVTVYTPGKEIENIFLSPKVLKNLIPNRHYSDFEVFWEEVFEANRLDAYSSYLTLHDQFLPSRLDTKTITKKYTPQFEKRWADKNIRHKIIEGKNALQKLRGFFRLATGSNLTMQKLITACVDANDSDIRNFIEESFSV